MAEAYSNFAAVYDALMDNIPYDAWVDYLHSLLVEYDISSGILAELGCGTGNITERMADFGYDMIGIDNSPAMLDIANEKREQNHSSSLYLCQDMREFELYGTVAAIVSLCDSVNYITEPEELTHVFSLVNNYLDPDGLFIFDFHTEHYYRDVVAEATIAEDRDDISFIWDNYYDEEKQINEYDLALFIPEGKDGLYRKYEEVHYQRAYELELVKELLEKAGMEFVTAYDAFTKNPVNEKSERIYVIAREHGKKKN